VFRFTVLVAPNASLQALVLSHLVPPLKNKGGDAASHIAACDCSLLGHMAQPCSFDGRTVCVSFYGSCGTKHIPSSLDGVTSGVPPLKNKGGDAASHIAACGCWLLGHQQELRLVLLRSAVGDCGSTFSEFAPFERL